MHPGSGFSSKISPTWIRIQNSWNPATLKLVERHMKRSPPPGQLWPKTRGIFPQKSQGGWSCSQTFIIDITQVSFLSEKKKNQWIIYRCPHKCKTITKPSFYWNKGSQIPFLKRYEFWGAQKLGPWGRQLISPTWRIRICDTCRFLLLWPMENKRWWETSPVDYYPWKFRWRVEPKNHPFCKGKSSEPNLQYVRSMWIFWGVDKTKKTF